MKAFHRRIAAAVLVASLVVVVPATAGTRTAMAATDKIRKVAPEDLPEISSALSRAFFDDPLSARGGRLVMRLLAVTAEPTARGPSTAADQMVGQISVDGTLRFIVFTGLSFPSAYLICGADYSAGRTAGVAFGTLLLVLAGTRLEPLRPGNPDLTWWAGVGVGGRLRRAGWSVMARWLPPWPGG